MEYIRTCKICGNEFKPKRTMQYCCSSKCKNKEYNAKYYLEHKKDKQERDRIRRKKITEEKQKYYEEHKEEIEQEKLKILNERILKKREYMHNYSIQNREKLNAYRREYFKKNPEKYEKHKRKCTEYQKKRYKIDEAYRKYLITKNKEYKIRKGVLENA